MAIASQAAEGDPNVLNLTRQKVTRRLLTTLARARDTPTPRRRFTFRAGDEVEVMSQQTTEATSPEVAAEGLASAGDYVGARELQVEAIIAGWDAKPPCIRWPQPTQETLSAWNARHDVHKAQPASARHNNTLFLADVDAKLRFSTFERECYLHRIRPTTASSMWGSWLSVARKLTPHAAEDADSKAITKKLQARATRCPIDFPVPATLAHLELIKHQYSAELPALTAVIYMAFLLGQRLSDMLQLAPTDMAIEAFDNDEFLTITVRRSKVSHTRPPFTLHLPRTVYPAQQLIEAAERAQTKGQLFLLSSGNTQKERDALSEACAAMLKDAHEDLQLRSVRRGGLQRLAAAGATLEELLMFSHHANTDMLLRYLGWGRKSAHHARTMATVLGQATSMGF
jgi:hypothetical protein